MVGRAECLPMCRLVAQAREHGLPILLADQDVLHAKRQGDSTSRMDRFTVVDCWRPLCSLASLDSRLAQIARPNRELPAFALFEALS